MTYALGTLYLLFGCLIAMLLALAEDEPGRERWGVWILNALFWPLVLTLLAVGSLKLWYNDLKEL